MRHLGGCTECFTVWWACRCPLRCEECGAGYRDDGNSSCGTVGCQAGQRRVWAMMDRWERHDPEPAGVQCEAVGSPAEPSSSDAEGGAMTTPPLPRPPERRRPVTKAHTERHTPQPSTPAHRPVAERRAAVEALLSEDLSDREIARRAQVSPSTVSTIRTAREAAKTGA